MTKDQAKETVQGSEPREYSQFVKIFLNVAYAIISSGITFVNKHIFLNFGFQSPIDLLLIQCLCNIVFTLPMMIYKEKNKNAFKTFDEYGMTISTISESSKKMKQGIKVSILNIITVVFGVYSVKYISIPIWLTFRRCSLITTFLISFMINNVPVTRWNLLKMGLVATGAIIAGVDTFNKDWFGFLMIWMNNFSNSYYTVYVNKINKSDKLTPWEINAYYSIIGLPVFTAMTLMNGEIYLLSDAFFNSSDEKAFWLIFYLLLSGILGIAITLSTLLVTTVCSPFSLNVSGSIKNNLSALLSFIVFDDIVPSKFVVTGISVGFMGNLLQMKDELSRFKAKKD